MKQGSLRKFFIAVGMGLTLTATSTLVLADTGCSTAPKSKFQDRAKLDDILKPKGLMINKILDNQGCYKVIAVTQEFKKTVLFFNAETLKQVDMVSTDIADQNTKDFETDGD